MMLKSKEQSNNMSKMWQHSDQAKGNQYSLQVQVQTFLKTSRLTTGGRIEHNMNLESVPDRQSLWGDS